MLQGSQTRKTFIFSFDSTAALDSKSSITLSHSLSDCRILKVLLPGTVEEVLGAHVPGERLRVIGFPCFVSHTSLFFRR